MSKHMERDLDRLQRDVLTMAGLVEEVIVTAARALQTFDPDLSAEVIAADTEIDRWENEIHDECLKILALHQPVAVDLRRVSSVLLIVTDLERMADLAVSIAERARTLSRPPYPHVPERIEGMTIRTATMVRDSLDAFVRRDAAAARKVVLRDDDVDRDNESIIAELIHRMKTQPNGLEADLSLFSAVRNLERIADHATNIAEDVIYLVEGEVARHHPEVLDRVVSH